jgi:hypothetical protein
MSPTAGVPEHLSLDDGSPVFFVPWTMHPLYFPFLGRCVPCIFRPGHLFFPSGAHVFSVPWVMRPLYFPSLIGDVSYRDISFKGHILQQIHRPGEKMFRDSSDGEEYLRVYRPKDTETKTSVDKKIFFFSKFFRLITEINVRIELMC